MVVRHGEKPTPGTTHGVTARGNHDHDSLTVPGWTRAGGLVALFRGDAATPGRLRRPDRIYGADALAGHSKRSIQTVAPLAARLGLKVDTRYRSGEEADLVDEIRHLPGSTLVCWHHKTVHRIVAHLGPVTPVPPDVWPDHRFDVVWTFTRTSAADRWVFAQVPQLLLADDGPDPITGPSRGTDRAGEDDEG